MRCLILLLSGLLIGCVCNAQRFSLPQLIKMNSMSLEDFHSYISTKKYKLYEVDNDKRTYTYGQTRTNIYAIKVVTKEINTNPKKQVIVFQTLASGDYLNVQSQLDDLKFRLVNSKKSKSGTKFLFYRKDKTEVSLASDLYYNSSGEKMTFYQIKVSEL